MLDIYEMYLRSPDGTGDDNQYEEGPFKVKIKMTDDMKEYNKYYLVFLTKDLDVTEEVIELTKNGEYLEGTLDHFSTYAIVGKTAEESIEETPKTGDKIVIYIIFGILSTIGIISVKKITNQA